MDEISLGNILEAASQIGFGALLLVLFFKIYIPHIEKMQQLQVESFERSVDHAINSASDRMKDLTELFNANSTATLGALQAIVKRLETIENKVQDLSLRQQAIDTKLEVYRLAMSDDHDDQEKHELLQKIAREIEEHNRLTRKEVQDN